MKFIKSIFNFFKKLLKKIIDFIKKYWVIILAVVVIWFAPQISAFLLSSGAPTWMVQAFTWVGSNITPYLMKAGSWLGSAASSVWGTAAKWFGSLSFGQKLAALYGAVAVVDPESAANIGKALVEDLSNVGGAIIGTGISAVTGSPLLLAAGGFALYWLFFRKKKKKADSHVVILGGASSPQLESNSKEAISYG